MLGSIKVLKGLATRTASDNILSDADDGDLPYIVLKFVE